MFKFSWTREWKETIEKGRDLKKKKNHNIWEGKLKGLHQNYM